MTGRRILAYGNVKMDHGQLFGFDSYEPKTTTYRSGYGPDDSVTAAPVGSVGSSRTAAQEFERKLRTAVCSVDVPADISRSVISGARTTSYARDFAEVHVAGGPPPTADRGTARPPEVSSDRGPITCEPFVVTPTINVKYTGAAPPEKLTTPKSEYTMTHGLLGNRVIAERMHAKRRNKRCR